MSRGCQEDSRRFFSEDGQVSGGVTHLPPSGKVVGAAPTVGRGRLVFQRWHDVVFGMEGLIVRLVLLTGLNGSETSVLRI